MSVSETLFEQAKQVLPGGVTASFRINKATGRPLYIARGDGALVSTFTGTVYVMDKHNEA